MEWLFRTKGTLVPLVLRLGLAVVIFPHGAQKVLGWFGGHGFTATMASFTQNMQIPALLVILVMLAEFLGPLALVFAFLTRIAAFGIGVVMATAVVRVHLPHGFFMNWSGAQAGEGFEYHILALTISLALMLGGGGKWGLDAWIHRKLSLPSSTEPHPY